MMEVREMDSSNSLAVFCESENKAFDSQLSLKIL